MTEANKRIPHVNKQVALLDELAAIRSFLFDNQRDFSELAMLFGSTC